MLRCDALHFREGGIEVVAFHPPADRVATVLGLCRELELCDVWIAATAEHDDDLGRTGRQVDRDVPRDDELRLVHERVARPDDLVDATDGVRPVGEGGDRVRSADRPHLVDAEELRGGCDEPAATGRRDDHDPLNPCRARRYRTHHESRDEAARNVDTHGAKRDPPPLELDARLDLHAEVGRTLRFVPAVDTAREREHGLLGQLPLGPGARRLDAVELERPFPERLVAAVADVGDDLRDAAHPSIRSTGTSRIDEAPAASSAGSSCHTSVAGITL